MNWAIETFSLSKYFPSANGCFGLFPLSYHSQAAVDQVTFAVKPAEIFGLLGANGAGKTTLIKMLATLIIPSSGSARINGSPLFEAEKVRGAITLVGSDERSFYWRLTGRQNLEFFAALYHLPPPHLHSRIKEVLHLTGLEEAAEVPVKAFSAGMKQRLAIARALLAKTPILLLDEPTKGLDPAATRRLHNLIREELAGRQGITVVLATNQLWEAEALCHRVAVMRQGHLQGCGALSELRHDLGLSKSWRLVTRNLTPSLSGLLEESFPRLGITAQDGGDFLIEWGADNDPGAEEVIRVILQGGGKILGFSEIEASPEVIFDTLVNQPDPGIIIGQKPGQAQEREKTAVLKEAPGADVTSTTERQKVVNVLTAWLRMASSFVKRDFLEEWSYRFAFSLRLLSIFFSVTMFYFLSKLFGQTVNPYLSPYGVDYFTFVLLGIGFSQYFDVGLSAFSHSLREAQTTGTLEAMLATPTNISLIIICSSLWSLLFASLQVAFYLGMGQVLFKAHLGDFSLTVLLVIIILTIICFSSLGIIAAGFIMVYKRGDPIIWLFSTTSALLSGVYYPVAILPGWLKPLAYWLPNTYVLEAVRKAFIQGCSLSAIRQELIVLSLFCLILMPLSLMFFRLAVHRAKVAGSLTHY
ncbi:MAG: ABC transporter ATP-binding protein/permease [Deltaproteobacteria bacterium]